MVQLKWYRRTQWTWLLSMSNLKPCCSYYCPGCLDTCVHSEWEEVVVKQPVLKYGAWIRMLWCHDEWCILGRRRLSVQGEDDSCDRTQILMLKYVFYLYICVHFAYLKIPFVLLFKSLHDTFTNNIWNRFRTRSQNETHTPPHMFLQSAHTPLFCFMKYIVYIQGEPMRSIASALISTINGRPCPPRRSGLCLQWLTTRLAEFRLTTVVRV